MSDQVVGYLVLKMDTRFIINAINSIKSQGLLIAGLEILASILLLGLIGLALTKHLLALTRAANKMAQGDLSTRIPIQAHDEIGMTASAFNQMATRISEDQSALLFRENKIIQLNEELEDRVKQRTEELQETNTALQASFDVLKQTQNQLIESEKMAALGGLVAGISHEINTPVGVSVTAASHLQYKIKQYIQQYQGNTLTREDFELFIDTAQNSSQLILDNLDRAASLIRSFKQIAVDQTHDEARRFNLKTYLSEILLSLQPELKKYQPSTVINCVDDLELHSYPGVISQIITNLVMNSLIHGFEDMGKQQKHINIDITSSSQLVTLCYRDNGKGISTDHANKIFEPFFTTKRNQGGSGLGMHIVYNLVSQTLGGSITCQSQSGEGIFFQITIPRHNTTPGTSVS